MIIYSQCLPEASIIKVIMRSIFPTSQCIYAESAFTTNSTNDHNQSDLLPQRSAQLRQDQHPVRNKIQTRLSVAMRYVSSG